MLFQPSLEAIIRYAINHIKNFPITLYYQYKPQTVKPPLIVYRIDKEEKPKFQRFYKTTENKVYHKIADAKLNIHLFLIAHQNSIFTLSQRLDSHIFSIKNPYIDDEYIKFTYRTFQPFESKEFEKERYLTMEAILTAHFPILKVKDTIQVSVKNVKQN